MTALALDATSDVLPRGTAWYFNKKIFLHFTVLLILRIGTKSLDLSEMFTCFSLA